jgi:glutamyl-tRNA reductase
MAVEPGGVVALVTHARRVPAIERERFALQARGWRRVGGLLLETCHRVEAYLVTDRAPADLRTSLPEGGRLVVGQAAVRHAISVAVGLDSVVVGEDQVLHQLRQSVTTARHDGGLDPTLERLFILGLRAGRRARSWRQGPALSMADLALAAVERRVGPVRGRPLLVMGAGEMGRLTARAATAAGAHVSIASRTAGRADALAAQVGAQTMPFDPGPRVGDVAAIVVALRGPWPIAPSTVEALAASRLVVVDLSVPPAVSEALAATLGARFVSGDALALTEPDTDTFANGPVSRLEALVDATTAEFAAWLDGREQRATARALAERAERERQAELDDLWRRLPRLEPEVREVIDGMSRHFAARLLREPLERLGQDPDGRHERAVRELFGL